VTGKLEATQSLISSHKNLVLARESSGRYPSPLLKKGSRQVFTHSNRWHTGKKKLNRGASASTTTAGGHKHQVSATKIHKTDDQDQAFCFSHMLQSSLVLLLLLCLLYWGKVMFWHCTVQVFPKSSCLPARLAQFPDGKALQNRV